MCIIIAFGGFVIIIIVWNWYGSCFF